MIEDPCPSCAGSGRVTRDRTLSVNIPQGVEDGTRIRLAGEGEAGVRGVRRATSIFSCRWPATSSPARWRRPALPGSNLDGGGGPRRRVEVPTIDKGKTKVKVRQDAVGPAFRIASKGMPVLRSRQTGDMYVQ